MYEELQLRMWSRSSIDLDNVDLVLDHQRIVKTGSKFEPSPYTFTKLENGKKVKTNWLKPFCTSPKRTADSSSLTPPSWLLLDHSIAVIWSMFNMNPSLQHLSIDDLKWAYEFLKGIKNKKGENPPDVKVCLKEIQDRLINLYAKLTSLKEEDLGEVDAPAAAAFGEKIIQDSTTKYLDAAFTPENNIESKFDSLTLSSCNSPLSLNQEYSSKDITKTGIAKKLTNSSKITYSLPEEESDVYEETEAGEDEEVEKYILSLFEGEKKEEPVQIKPSLIPTKKKTDAISTQDMHCKPKKLKKTSKKVHCVAEMRSVKFQKSMKVKDTNGEEAAYSNLKAEIKRLTINPKVSRHEVMKFLKDWRSEQVNRLHNELKRLSSIEEFMKNLNTEEAEPNLRMNSHLTLKDLETENSIYSWRKHLLP